MRFGRVAALLPVVAVALAALSASAQAAKPDLVIAGSATVNPDYGFRGEGDNITFTDRTKNKGKGKARASETSLVLLRPPQVSETAIASRSVPKLKPGKADTGLGGDSLPDVVPGAYDVIVCADFKDKVKEKNESNNCSDLGQFSVVQRAWFGTLSGSGPTAVSGVNESWESDDAGFEFVENLGDGRFKYKFFGSVRYTVSGTDSEGCTWSGSDTTSIAGNGAGQGLILDYRKEEYFGNDGISGFPFLWDQACPAEFPVDQAGPLSVAGGFIVVNPQELDTQPMPFGSTTLIGTATSEANGSQFSWLLGAGN